MYSKPLSYSGLSLYKRCPRRWHNTYILGNREQSGKAAERGTYLHELLESYFQGKTPYPSGNSALAPSQSFMEGLARHDAVAEGEVAVNQNWQPVGYEDEEAFFRGKKDLDIPAGETLLLFDWKSGRVYDDHVFQGEAYSALTPGFGRYIVHFVYLDQPHTILRWEYSAEEVVAIRERLTEQIMEVRSAENYDPIPGDHCGWCPLSWRNGGDCKRAR